CCGGLCAVNGGALVTYNSSHGEAPMGSGAVMNSGSVIIN
ncbi:hypothetical protein A2U01_0061143, partial [Trifolium medium]|nr:hypothetical protein [Trifolium medium]